MFVTYAFKSPTLQRKKLKEKHWGWSEDSVGKSAWHESMKNLVQILRIHVKSDTSIWNPSDVIKTTHSPMSSAPFTTPTFKIKSEVLSNTVCAVHAK